MTIGSDDLGFDGLCQWSYIYCWIRPGATLNDSCPIVYTGNEGAVGVLTATPEAFVQALAYRACVDPYGKGTHYNYSKGTLFLDEAKEDTYDCCVIARLYEYRSVVVKRFGKLKSFQELTAGVDDLNKELMTWVNRIGSW